MIEGGYTYFICFKGHLFTEALRKRPLDASCPTCGSFPLHGRAVYVLEDDVSPVYTVVGEVYTPAGDRWKQYRFSPGTWDSLFQAQGWVREVREPGLYWCVLSGGEPLLVCRTPFFTVTVGGEVLTTEAAARIMWWKPVSVGAVPFAPTQVPP